MNKANLNHLSVRAGRQLRRLAGLIAVLGLLITPLPGAGGETPSLTEYQVKALFLLNFTKYVDWSPDAFAQTNSPIIIGVLGNARFGEDVKTAVAGKTISGRAVIMEPMTRGDDWSKCHVLFISAAEKEHAPEILARIKGRPILTVSEAEPFTEPGGIINFIKKDGKVRLEIDLAAAREAGLQINSRLLSVADTVRGKQ